MTFREGRIFAIFHKLETQGCECERASHYAPWPPAASVMEANHHNWWTSSWVTDEIQFPFLPLRGAVEKQTSLTFSQPLSQRENICIPTPPPWPLLAQRIHFSGHWVWRKKGLFPLGLLFGIHAVCLLSELSRQHLLWESGWSLPRSGPSGANRRLTGLVLISLILQSVLFVISLTFWSSVFSVSQLVSN